MNAATRGAHGIFGAPQTHAGCLAKSGSSAHELNPTPTALAATAPRLESELGPFQGFSPPLLVPTTSSRLPLSFVLLKNNKMSKLFLFGCCNTCTLQLAGCASPSKWTHSITVPKMMAVNITCQCHATRQIQWQHLQLKQAHQSGLAASRH
jgi:hypothetical protein